MYKMKKFAEYKQAIEAAEYDLGYKFSKGEMVDFLLDNFMEIKSSIAAMVIACLLMEEREGK